MERLSSALDEAVRKMDEGKEQRSRLLSWFAHDLMTPLTALRGNLEAIKEGVFEADDRIDLLIDQSILMERLIRDFHDLSRAQAGELTLNEEEIDAMVPLRQVVQSLRPLFTRHGIMLKIRKKHMPPCALDFERFKQIISTLLTSMLDYASPGGTVVTSCDRASRDGRSWLRISIEESGPARAKKQLTEGIEGLSGKENYASPGIHHFSLALTLGLIEAHGGKIEMPAAGNGPILSLFFPL
jgi:signal transduction histidine kinase